jgi:hypothetical protein
VVPVVLPDVSVVEPVVELLAQTVAAAATRTGDAHPPGAHQLGPRCSVLCRRQTYRLGEL